MRLARGIAQHRRAARPDRRHDGVLGARHARFIEEDVRTVQPSRREANLVGEDVLDAELLEREEVGVEPAAADDVTAWRRKGCLPAADEERRGEEDRAADSLAHLEIEGARGDRAGVHLQRVGRGPSGLRSGGRDELDQDLDVPDARHIQQRDWVLRKERCSDDWKRRVLVAGRADGAAERAAAFDEESHAANLSVEGGLGNLIEPMESGSGLRIGIAGWDWR